jgi:hypothetical protein
MHWRITSRMVGQKADEDGYSSLMRMMASSVAMRRAAASSM